MTTGGEQLGRYHLVRKLAQGGMAEVFLAKVMGPGGFEKSMVIKRILPALAKDPEFVSMFLQEARLAAQFAHPAVVQIFDFGEVNGSFFLAMEFIDGPNLRSILRAAPERRIPLAIGARIIEQACEGLAYVHEFADGAGEPLGLMHCDVSTDNMLVARNGAVKVVDFGVARGAGQASNAEPGTVKGKIAYMPPEQIIGEADLRADVYALGVILYELAAGTRPYEYKSDQQLLESIIRTDPVPLLERRPDVPPEYARLVEKAMAKNLSVRFQSCRELAAALEDFIAGSGERVTTRQLAALATQHQELPEPSPSTNSSATPFGKQPGRPQLTAPRGPPTTSKVPPTPLEPAAPFAAFGAPVARPPPKPDPFAAFGAPAPSSPSPLPRPPPAPSVSSPVARAPAPAPAPAPARYPPQSAEARAASVMAAATSMRLYEPGGPLAPLAELEAVALELDRDEGLNLLVRFGRHAARLLKSMDNGQSLIAERVAGAVEGLLLAEAYGPLATLLSTLQASAGLDAHHRAVCELALSVFATEDQARRLAMRLREAAPTDVDGLGRLIPFFGGALAPVWLALFETLELPASRDAVLPGLAGLASQNAAPFLEKLEPKRPRRLTELVYCLEKGRAPERHKLVKDLLTRLDTSRRREVLMGLAKAASDDAFRLVCQGLTDEAEELQVLSIQLLGKHFPERAFKVLEPLLAAASTETRSEAHRRALWVAVASSPHPAALQALIAELSLKPSLLNRSKIETRKLDALDGLAALTDPRAEALMKQFASDASQPDSVRAAADGHLRAAALINQTTKMHSAESRRWERAPGTWRDVLLELHSLSCASRLIDVGSPSFDVAFARLASRQARLLQNAQAVVACAPTLTVNGAEVSEANDSAIAWVTASLKSRGIASFTFVRHAPRADLEQLVRWLAAGAQAEGIETPSLTRTLTTQALPKAAPSLITVPPMADLSRETMIRYVDLVLSFRGWLQERKLKPLAAMPEVRQTLHELAAAVSSRSVRMLGLTPRDRDRDAELFHSANVMLLSLGFGAELGLPTPRLVELASHAFFSNVGNLGLKDETLERVGKLTAQDQLEVAAAKRWSVRFPFVMQGDKPGAVAWAMVVAEQELEWGTRKKLGAVGPEATVGLMGGLVALARNYDGLTSATATREAMSRDAAIEVLTTKISHRFRPELLPLFIKFIRRQTARPLS